MPSKKRKPTEIKNKIKGRTKKCKSVTAFFRYDTISCFCNFSFHRLHARRR